MAQQTRQLPIPNSAADLAHDRASRFKRLVSAGLLATVTTSLTLVIWLTVAILARPLPQWTDLQLIRGTVTTAYSDCDYQACTMFLTVSEVPGVLTYPEVLPQTRRVERALRPGRPVILGILPDRQSSRIWHAETGDRVIAPFDEVVAVTRIHRAAAGLLALALLDVAALAGLAFVRCQGRFEGERGSPLGSRAGLAIRQPAVIGLAVLGALIGYWWAARGMYWLSVLDAEGATAPLWLAITLVSGGVALGAMARWGEIPRSVRWSLLAGGFLYPLLAFLLGRHALPIEAIARFTGEEPAGLVATLLVFCSPSFCFVLAPAIGAALPGSAELRRATLIGLCATSVGSTIWLALVVPSGHQQRFWLGLDAALAIWSLYVGLRSSLRRERIARLTAQRVEAAGPPSPVLVSRD